MSDKNVPFWLYDLRSRPQYIAHNAYATFLNETVFKKGFRGPLEKAWLKVQKFYPKHLVKETQFINYWNKLSHSLQQPIKAALLWRTDWYKTTLFVGSIATEDRRLFVKAYRKPDEAILAVHQASFIHYYFHPHFTTVKPTQHDDNFVFYPLLPHHAKEPDIRQIADKLIEISKDYHDVFRFNTKPALDYVNLNLPSLLQKEGRIEFWKDLRNLLTASPAIASIPVHGDITPWNLFNSDHTLPVLIDYERAGWHVPYYDWWHLQYQYSILHHRIPSLDNLLNKLQTESGQDRIFLLRTGLIYMLDQLSYDLQDRDDYPKYKNRLTSAIHIRFKIAESFVRKLHEAANAA